MIYCKLCYPKIWHTPLPADPRAIAAKIQEGEEGGGCPRCGGKVSGVLSPRNVEEISVTVKKRPGLMKGEKYSKTTQNKDGRK